MSGRDVTLRIYTEAKDIDRVSWAMESLKQAMKWDEETFGTSRSTLHTKRYTFFLYKGGCQRTFCMMGQDTS